jgi:hypothetical protein
MAMKLFVNREEELRMVEEALEALLDRKRLLRTPIIDFYGVRGIGKTAILREIRQRCVDSNLPFIWAEVSRNLSGVSQQLMEQVQQYLPGPVVPPQNDFLEEDSLVHPVEATRRLLDRRGAAVMLLDAVDASDKALVRWLEHLLRELIERETLFVVLASQSALAFEQERAVARKLISIELEPLDRRSCEDYLNSTGLTAEAEVHNLIFEWTRGYPLAMEVMTEAVQSGLDPRTPAGQQAILKVLTERVISGGVLRNVEPARQPYYESALRLLSVPRRFNLLMLQDLIERFAPQLRRESSLAYFSLPGEIRTATQVLTWQLSRAGYAVETPVRHLFLLKLRLEDLQTFVALHQFLADTNRALSRRVSGSDRMRYLREYLYHSAFAVDAATLQEICYQLLEEIRHEPAESHLQFAEEFSLDRELQEVLGPQRALLASHLPPVHHAEE